MNQKELHGLKIIENEVAGLLTVCEPCPLALDSRFQYEVIDIRIHEGYTPANTLSVRWAGTADWLLTEVSMEPSTISGPIYYLLIVWAVVTGIFLLLLVWRTLLTSHEGDQIFLDAAQEHMAREQREVVAKIMKLQKPITTTGITAGTLLLVIAGMWIYQGLKNF